VRAWRTMRAPTAAPIAAGKCSSLRINARLRSSATVACPLVMVR
jgi:hypothetical protein